MQPILGKNGLIYFMESSAYVEYACVEDFTITFQIESKSVKTVGDGPYVNFRGQRVHWSVIMSGLVVTDEPARVTTFDLLQYVTTMSFIPMRIIWNEPIAALVKVFEGNVLPVELAISAPTSGYSDNQISFEGCGPYSIRDTVETCSSTIGTVFIGNAGGGVIDVDLTGVTGSPIRYEYWIDSGTMQTAFTEPWSVAGITAGSHQINIYPVCANGIRGTLKTQTFSI